MRLPKSFNEITISQFQECYFLINSKDEDPDDPIPHHTRKWVKVISVLGKVEDKYLYALPGDKLKRLIQQLSFLLDDERLSKRPKKYVFLKGGTYKAQLEIQKFSNNQAIDVRMFMRSKDGTSDKDTIVENAHKLLASIYQKLTWKGWVYDGLSHEKISNDFLNAKMGDVYGTLFFYSNVWENWIKHIADCGKEAEGILIPHFKELEEWMRSRDLGTIGGG